MFIFECRCRCRDASLFIKHNFLISKAFCTLIFVSEMCGGKSFQFSACQVDEFALNNSVMAIILFSHAIYSLQCVVNKTFV